MTRGFRGWRLRSLLIAIAITAAMLAMAKSSLKPRPMEIEDIGAFQIVFWSDGTATTNANSAAWVIGGNYGLIGWDQWSDGTTTYHLHGPGL